MVVEDLQDPNKVPDSIPETFLETPYQAVQPTECVSKAEKTSIDLSNHRTEDPNELDVKFNGERILLEDQPKRARSLDHEEDAKAVRREIFEMRSSLSLRVLVLGLLAVISGYLALADSYSLPIFANMRLAAAPRSYVGMQLLFGLLGTATAASVIGGGIRKLFHVPDGASLLAAMVVLAIMILPSIIKVSVNALDAVPKEYEDASLALGATPVETWFRVSAPAARSGIAAAVVLGVGRAIGEAMAVMMVSGNAPNMPSLFESVRFLTTAVASEMSYASGLQRQALFSIALVLYLFIMLINAALNFFLKRKKE